MHSVQVGKLNALILFLLIATLSAGCKDSSSQATDPEISLPNPAPELQFLINQESWERLPKHIQQALKIARWTASFDMHVQSGAAH